MEKIFRFLLKASEEVRKSLTTKKHDMIPKLLFDINKTCIMEKKSTIFCKNLRPVHFQKK